MNKYRLLLTAGTISIMSMVSASAALAASMSAQDFVRKASIANEFEIESSQLALDKSKNSDVKKFAQRMVDDHTKTAEKLKDTLQSSQSGAQPADGLDDKHQKMLDQLQSASTDNFDSRYVTMQTNAHKEAINLFSGYAAHGKDPALKGFASQTLPTLKKHLMHVQKL